MEYGGKIGSLTFGWLQVAKNKEERDVAYVSGDTVIHGQVVERGVEIKKPRNQVNPILSIREEAPWMGRLEFGASKLDTKPSFKFAQNVRLKAIGKRTDFIAKKYEFRYGKNAVGNQ